MYVSLFWNPLPVLKMEIISLIWREKLWANWGRLVSLFLFHLIYYYFFFSKKAFNFVQLTFEKHTGCGVDPFMLLLTLPKLNY